MKVHELVDSLRDVPGVLRCAAQELRSERIATRDLEKVAARYRIADSISQSSPRVNHEELDELDLSSAVLEKLAANSARWNPLGVASSNATNSGRTGSREFLEGLRSFT